MVGRLAREPVLGRKAGSEKRLLSQPGYRARGKILEGKPWIFLPSLRWWTHGETKKGYFKTGIFSTGKHNRKLV
jgi:hypothetical protein